MTALAKLPKPKYLARLSKDGEWLELLPADDWTAEMWAHGTEPVYSAEQMRAALSPAELGGVERTFADAEALATWLESLHEADASGAVNHRKWEPAQRAAAAIRATNLREVDSIALEVAKRFTLDTEPQRRASLQCAVIDAIVRSTPRAAEASDAVELLQAYRSRFGATRPDDEDDAREWDRIETALEALTPPSAKGECRD